VINNRNWLFLADYHCTTRGNLPKRYHFDRESLRIPNHVSQVQNPGLNLMAGQQTGYFGG
jgi:hypothetical protein